ncbi:hypothetical protein [Stenomitos frigidus]|uniref:Uncharacterized protein n=1 Tax=Stenomitos frigidus ULC18 TaxID=2107698 RepID=A0A2T1EAY5_9CYAN|nr:hypothetical protein [Stenomitos frigidus]PSB29926.1 hypothetical protein C7B82_10260 [Stenomitos frigidus ULC18]
MTNTSCDPLSPGEQAPLGSTQAGHTNTGYELTWEQALQDYKDGLITRRGLRHYQALLQPPTSGEVAE